MQFKGNVHRYGRDIDTDVIYCCSLPQHYLEPSELAKHCLEDLDVTGFVNKVSQGDIIVCRRKLRMRLFS